MRCDPRKRQQQKTAKRKARQEKALKRLLAHPQADLSMKEGVRRIGFYRLPQITKQQIMERFG